jgi:hypothetical protein
MEQQRKLKINKSTYHRLNIQHKMDETNLKQEHLLNVQFYKHREEMFNRKIALENFHLLNLSSQASIYNKSNKQISNHLPRIPDRSNSDDEKYFQVFLNQQIFNENKNQLKYNERKAILLKQFDELKHTINDPHSTLSVLAALSRALLYLDSAIK